MSSSISGYSLYCSFYSAKSSDVTGDDQINYSASQATIISSQQSQQQIFSGEQVRQRLLKHMPYTFRQSATNFTYSVTIASIMIVFADRSDENRFAETVQGRSTDVGMKLAIAAGNFR